MDTKWGFRVSAKTRIACRSLASSPRFPYPTTAQLAEDSAVSSQAVLGGSCMAIEKPVAQAFLFTLRTEGPVPQLAASHRQHKLRSSGPIPASPLAGIDLRPSAISKRGYSRR